MWHTNVKCLHWKSCIYSMLTNSILSWKHNNIFCLLSKMYSKHRTVCVLARLRFGLEESWFYSRQRQDSYFVNLVFIGRHIIVIVEEWKTNLMSLAILFHFLYAQHVSDINISIIRSLRLCCWITTSVLLFCKDGGFSVSVNLRCLVVCVWCDVFCRFVVVGRCILIDFDRYLLCFVIIVCACVWYVYIGCMAQLVLQPAKRAPPKTSRTKSPTHKELRTRRPMW